VRQDVTGVAVGPTGLSGVDANPPDAELRRILARTMTIAVVGWSTDPARDSHRIALLLAGRGHHVIPVNPAGGAILGTPCYPSLRDVPVHVDMVDVFRRPEAVPDVVEDAITIGAAILWLQLGVVHHEAAARARAAGLTVVMDRCPAIEYPRLLPATARS
jgi:uncharacterized protein